MGLPFRYQLKETNRTINIILNQVKKQVFCNLLASTEAESPPFQAGSPIAILNLSDHFTLTGRTSICMKLFCALTLRMRMVVPVTGVITLPNGFVGS
jgi:hypothetical protein